MHNLNGSIRWAALSVGWFFAQGCADTRVPVEATDSSLVSARALPEYGEADGEAIPIEMKAQTSLGFSADDIRRLVEGEHHVPVHWLADDGGGKSKNSTQSALTVRVQSRGRARFYDAENEPFGHGVALPSWLELDVTVHLTSDSSTSRSRIETFSATVYSATRHIARLRAHAPLDAEASGVAALAAGRLPAEVSDSHIEMELNFTKGTVSGQLRSTSHLVGSWWMPWLELAYLGPVDCHFPQAAAKLSDTIGGVTGADMLAKFSDLAALRVRWNDGQTSAVSAKLDGVTDGACLVPAHTIWGFALKMHVPSTLSLASEDGVVDGEWPGTLTRPIAGYDGPDGPRFSLSNGAASPGALATDLGFPKIALDGPKRLVVAANLRLSESGELSGEVGLTEFSADGPTEHVAGTLAE